MPSKNGGFIEKGSVESLLFTGVHRFAYIFLPDFRRHKCLVKTGRNFLHFSVLQNVLYPQSPKVVNIGFTVVERLLAECGGGVLQQGKKPRRGGGVCVFVFGRTGCGLVLLTDCYLNQMDEYKTLNRAYVYETY